jgi:hypothetical protein
MPSRAAPVSISTTTASLFFTHLFRPGPEVLEDFAAACYVLAAALKSEEGRQEFVTLGFPSCIKAMVGSICRRY